MTQRRDLIWYLLLLLVSLGIIALLAVFFNSLFTAEELSSEEKQSATTTTLDFGNLKPGEIATTIWDGKQIAVLKRPPDSRSDAGPTTASSTQNGEHVSIDPQSRSQKPDYFVYINIGDSGNCPLFYGSSSLKDVCSGKRFDLTGREITLSKVKDTIGIPPHYFDGTQIIIGTWE